jgi:hypothetical protein
VTGELWTWDAQAPGASAGGVSAEQEQAEKAAAAWLRKHPGATGRVQPVLLVTGAGLGTRHEPAGAAWEARRLPRGRITWAPVTGRAGGAGEA